MRRIRDNDTGESYYTQTGTTEFNKNSELGQNSKKFCRTSSSIALRGEGIFDTIASDLGKAGSKVAEKGTQTASNKLAKKVGSLALEKAGEKIVNKILPPPIERIEKNLENKGSQIIQELKKLQPREKQTTEYKSDSYFSDQFDKLINM